jgi:hypothetical protein
VSGTQPRLGLGIYWCGGPRVGLRGAGQPWALGRNPVGIGGRTGVEARPGGSDSEVCADQRRGGCCFAAAATRPGRPCYAWLEGAGIRWCRVAQPPVTGRHPCRGANWVGFGFRWCRSCRAQSLGVCSRAPLGRGDIRSRHPRAFALLSPWAGGLGARWAGKGACGETRGFGPGGDSGWG